MFKSPATGWYFRVNPTAGGVAGPFSSHDEADRFRKEVVAEQDKNQERAYALMVSGFVPIETFESAELGLFTTVCGVSLPRYLKAGQRWASLAELLPA